MTTHIKKRRVVNGVLPYDKPLSQSSNAALQHVKSCYMAKKAGHGGSLDPLASGLLLICFGEGTKLLQFLLEADKKYRVRAKLGVRTTTGDAEGEVVSRRDVPPLTKEKLEEVFKQFTGSIEQVPSMFSALKHQGQPLYQLARQGITVERKSRTINIHTLTLEAFDQPDEIECFVHCSKGTYIRTLIEDIGEALGCGAYVTELRRDAVGPFEASSMVTTEQLEAAASEGEEGLSRLLLPIDSCVSVWPEVGISEAAAFYLKQGQPVIVPETLSPGHVRLRMKGGPFIGVGEVLEDGRITPRRLVRGLA